MRKLQPKVTELGKARIGTIRDSMLLPIMNTASLGMSVQGEGAGLAWSLDSWCWHSPRQSCPHPVLNSVVTVSHLYWQWSLRGASLFLQMLPPGPLRTKGNLWGPGPTRGWPFRGLSPPVVHRHPGTTPTCSVLRASPEDWTPPFHLHVLRGWDSPALFWSHDALRVSVPATNEAETVLKLLPWSSQSYPFWNVLELFFSGMRENLSVTLSTLLGTKSESLWFNIPNSLLVFTDCTPLCMLFFNMFHKILPNTDPGRMLSRTAASSVYSASCPWPLVWFPTHNKAYPSHAPCVVLPQKHTHISFQLLRCRTSSQMS